MLKVTCASYTGTTRGAILWVVYYSSPFGGKGQEPYNDTHKSHKSHKSHKCFHTRQEYYNQLPQLPSKLHSISMSHSLTHSAVAQSLAYRSPCTTSASIIMTPKSQCSAPLAGTWRRRIACTRMQSDITTRCPGAWQSPTTSLRARARSNPSSLAHLRLCASRYGVACSNTRCCAPPSLLVWLLSVVSHLQDRAM
jgi:hypothetical protein